MSSKLYQRYRYSLILLKELVITEFKLRYQGSVLGYLWSLLKPLFLFTILYFVFVFFLRVGSDIPHWPVALLLGIVLWNFFGEITNNGLGSIVGRGDVIRKINFPKYVIVLASSISAFINL
ncbi:MAG: ABC transporter permease, partial [Candidatus Saccharimonadales bacterium]